jgi:hypothetical protein
MHNFYENIVIKVVVLKILYLGMLRPQTPDPLLSASDKSGQKRLLAHFAISNNVSLRSPLVKFEAEPMIIFKIYYDSIFYENLKKKYYLV